MANSSSDYNSKNYKDLALVPETILKRRHDLDEKRRQRAAEAQLVGGKGNKKDGEKKTFYVKKLETFIAQGRSRRNNETRYKRVLKKGMQKRASNKKVMTTRELEEEERTEDGEEVAPRTVSYQSNSVGSPMVFVIRIRNHHGAPRMVKKALSFLRLRNENDGVFVRYNACTRKALHLVEPWVIYGRPTEGVISDLIERRGFGKIDGKRVPLADNTVIERALAEQNIICTEDLVHELHTVGESFSAAAKFLWPFKLSYDTSHFQRKILDVKRGKDYGDKGEAIDDYIKGIL